LSPEALGALTRAALESDCAIHPNPSDLVLREDLYLRLGRKSEEKPGVFLFIDGNGLLELLKMHESIDGNGIVLVQSEKDKPNLIDALPRLHNLKYILGWPQEDFAYSVARSILLNQPITQAIWHNHIAKEKILYLTNSQERQNIHAELLEKNENPSGGVANYSKYLADVCDEFLMNAIWDADPNRKNFDRTLSVPLPTDQKIEIRCQSDGNNFALTVQDNHGSFPESALNRIVKYALGSRNDAVINEGTGGAGVGLFMVLQKVAALCYEVTPGKSTKAMAVLRTDRSLKQMQKTLRTIAFTES
jgi:hypothetical protein